MSYDLPDPPIIDFESFKDRNQRYSMMALWNYLQDLKNARTTDLSDVSSSENKVFANLQLSSLTNNRLIRSNSVNTIVSTDISDWIAGTANEITVTDDTDGTVTISLPDVVYLGTAGKIGRDADNLLDFSTDNQITIRVNGATQAVIDSAGDWDLQANSLTTTGNLKGGIIRTNNYQNSVGDESLIWNPGEDYWEFGNDVYVNGGLQATGTITGGTLTDGTASMSAGSLTGVDDITMTGDLLIDSDTGQLKLGADQDLLVYHDGTDGYITNGTGVLKIPTGDLRFSDDGASDFSIGLLATAGNNPYFRLGGYLTSASDERWVSQQVSDVNDTYNIYRESPFIKGLEANMPILISTTTGYVLDGTSIDSKNQSAQNTIVIENYTASVNGGAGVIGHFARGIIASPVIVNPGDRLYFNLGGGYNGASMINSCGFEARITADGTSSLTSQPTEFSFLTTPDGSVSREEVLKIRSDYLWTKTPIYLTQKDGNEYIDSLADGYTDVGATTAIRAHADIYPGTDDTYYLGKNDDDTPFAWKGVILKDTSNNKYYRIEVINGVITATDLTD